MLKTLTIKNLILIEETTITFDKGFTVITGETGAGKTALIEALRLLLGERADTAKVRTGCEKAWIQASFAVTNGRRIKELFDESGFAFPEEEDLILTREIYANGKSRSFASGQMAPLSFLQAIGPCLIDFVGQHATISLKHPHKQREFVDLYAGVELGAFQTLWDWETSLMQQLAQIEREKQRASQKKEQLICQVQELEEAKLEKGGEESLFEEYTLLSNAQSLECSFAETIETADNALEHLRSLQKLTQCIETYGLGFGEAKGFAKEAVLQIEELRATTQRFSARLESDPAKLTYLEQRLSFLERLKKIYGKDLLAAKKNCEKDLAMLEGLDLQEEAVKQSYKEASAKTEVEVQRMRNMRQKAALELQSVLSKILGQLNMPTSEVKICVESAPRSKTGEDEVIFFLKANKGEETGPIKDSSSGGELSRLLFAIKIALAQKSSPKAMVFDEIDANVGGKTATKIGEFLHEIGRNYQVLCITHFPQVARQGDHHVCVSKIETGERTVGQIKKLSEKERDIEILRMLGGAEAPHLRI